MLQSQVSLLSLVTAATAAFSTALSLTSAPALADSFDFGYSGSGITASGILTTNPYDPSIVNPNTGQQTGGYLITGITGQRNGNSIDMLLSPNTVGGNDNLLFTISPYIDKFGFAYQSGGIDYYNAFNVAGGYFEQSSQTSSATPLTSFTITPPSPPPPTPVPEPSEEMVVVVMGVWIGGAWGLRKTKAVLSQRA
ncbi:MAG: hypothetical protein JO235_11325 [Chroococcidiopsidaceae cyanobacterium CP_BM_RX_35]|nr:hypothetical protein [Chroococcidiopsidaceae cyanobacterium CP_BM_RX_35]